MWNRFISVHGRPGKNIPGDLCLEHLNRLFKQAVNERGSNQSKKVIMFVGKVLGVLKLFLINLTCIIMLSRLQEPINS